MTKIGLLSDTHGWLDEAVFRHFENCDEIWHAGDFGGVQIAKQLELHAASGPKKKVFRGVWGNIDGHDLRSLYPEKLTWNCEQVPVYLTHIGGHPTRYAPGIKKELTEAGAKLFICGHSHILKIVYDSTVGCLHMNPGAVGKQGWHKVRTIIRFSIDGPDIKDCEVIELGKR